MPHLKSPFDAAAALGVSTGNNAPYNNDARFKAMLDGSTAQLERLLGTTFTQSGHRDHFLLDQRFLRNTEVFRLDAGFVDPASVRVWDCYGELTNSDQFTVDANKGTISLWQPRGGRYRVEYNAGFAVDEVANVFIGTPDWLRSLVDQTCTLWLRSIGTPKTIEGMSFGQHMSVIYRQLAGSVYGTYQRPRSPAHFPVSTEVLPYF